MSRYNRDKNARKRKARKAAADDRRAARKLAAAAKLEAQLLAETTHRLNLLADPSLAVPHVTRALCIVAHIAPWKPKP